ncbi:hypothetical protein ACIG0D_07670 [Streptomyces sp. NPDC052773]|uniref:hypothetical protein n=1 Tax=Streptomyces sp. NPDC052773 TaxID=3365693 RepID=UPI0037D6B6E7
MSDGTAALAPHEIALLRGGPRAAVTVALVALHLRGMVEPGPPGTVRAVPWHAATAELPRPSRTSCTPPWTGRCGHAGSCATRTSGRPWP